jgi:hypothetical protein
MQNKIHLLFKMSHRIINISKPTLLVYSSARNSVQELSTIKEMIDSLKGKKGTLIVPSGIYHENAVLPDGVSLVGSGYVQIIGTLTLEGEGMITSIDSDKIVVKGKRLGEKCNTSLLQIDTEGYFNCYNSHVAQVICSNGQFLIRNSTIGTNETYPVSMYSITLNNGIGLVESSTIEGSCMLHSGSVLDCKQTAVIGTDDLFQTQDETVTLQLFNCTVYGNNLIKSGPGTSIRSNVVALSDATVFEGGENLKIDSV